MAIQSPDPTCTVRPSRRDDASAISDVVLRALSETNSKDYSPEIIARVRRSFGPQEIEALMNTRAMFTAELDGCVVGTASLDATMVRTVFVAPDVQGSGVGRTLMHAVMQLAQDRGVAVLTVPSTVTAAAFYSKLGFVAVRDAYDGDERTIVMERRLAS